MQKRIKLIPSVEKVLLSALGLEGDYVTCDCLMFLQANFKLLSYSDVRAQKAYPIFERLVCTLAVSNSEIITIAKVVKSVMVCYPALSGIFLEVLSNLIKNIDSIEVFDERVRRSRLYVGLKFIVGVILGIFQGATHNNYNLDSLHYGILMDRGFNRKLFGVVSIIAFYPEEVGFQKYTDENLKRNIANLIKTYIKFKPLEFDLRSEVLSEIKNIRAIRQKEKKEDRKLTEVGNFLLENIIYAYYGAYDTDEKLNLIE